MGVLQAKHFSLCHAEYPNPSDRLAGAPTPHHTSLYLTKKAQEDNTQPIPILVVPAPLNTSTCELQIHNDAKTVVHKCCTLLPYRAASTKHIIPSSPFLCCVDVCLPCISVVDRLRPIRLCREWLLGKHHHLVRVPGLDL